MKYVIVLFIKKLDNKLIARSVVGAVIAGLIAVAFPITMFSGQHTLWTVLSDAGTYSFVAFVLIALGKLIATSTLIRTGFFGGPIFPAIFSGATLGLAMNTVFDVPMAVAVSATIAGIMVVSLRKPLSAAILTVAITGTENATLVAMAVSAGLIVLLLLDQRSTKSTKAS